MTASASAARVILITGLSGAGRQSCLRILEDHGFEAVDNLRLSLIPVLLAPMVSGGPLTVTDRIAIGVDTRTRDFDTGRLLADLQRLQTSGLAVSLVFLDCDSDVLIRRFTETRRRHPLATDRPVADAIRSERRLLAPIREHADLIIDSSQLLPADIRRLLANGLGLSGTAGLSVAVTSFGFRNGLPREADMVFDVRFLRNPYYDRALRPLDGSDSRVAGFIRQDAAYDAFIDGLAGWLEPLLPRYAAEGKSYLTIAVGCTGGRHRSVHVAGEIATWLRNAGYVVTLRHRDLEPARHGT